MPGVDTEKLQAVLHRLPELAVDPTIWPQMLEDVSQAAGAVGAVLLQTGPKSFDVPMSSGIEDLLEPYFRDGWGVRDPRERAVPQMMRGRIGVDQDIFAAGSMERDPMYAELLLPKGFRWWAGVGFRVGSDFWCLSLQRLARQGMFDEEEQRSLQRLIPVLSEVARISAAVGGAQLTRMTDAFDLVDQPALILDGLGNVTRVNSACEEVFDGWLSVRGGKLFGRDRRASAELFRLTQQIQTSRDQAGLKGQKIVLPRRDRRPVLLEPLSLSGAALGPFAAGRVLLLLHDLERRQAAVSKALLITLFGLTNAEAALAASLGDGETLASSADSLQITKETARSHLKRIFAKTETNRQTELVALLARLPSQSRPRR